MVNITFRFFDGSEQTIPASFSENLLDIAQRNGIAIDAPCSGNGTCGKCRVRLLSGHIDAAPSRHLSEEDYLEGWRLACCSTVNEDVCVEIPKTASDYQTGIRTADLSDPAVRSSFDAVQTDLKKSGLSDNSVVKTILVSMEKPSLDNPLPDNERLKAALQEATGCENITLSLTALRKMARILRENAFFVRCVCEFSEGEVSVLDVLSSNDTDPIYGLAIDIGTTTVSAALADLETGSLCGKASAGNGQIRFGADVINRIIESTREGGSERLRHAVVEETLLPLIKSLCRQAKITQDRIYRVVIAGNTTMSHLLLGLFSDPVRMEPYVPSFFICDKLRAYEVLPGLNKSASLVLSPNVGSYVGGDITAGVLASTLWNKEELSLFIDLGTNGELVLGNNEYMFTCACSAGPAFEGGDISCGMRATDGAIQSLSIDKESMEPTMDVIGGQKPLGLCGSGLLDTMAELFRAGIIDSRGKLIREGKRIVRDEHGTGRFILAFEEDSFDGREIALNEVDMDNFIRAKGAIFSAILLLLHQIGLEPEDIEQIQIAGGIGGGIDFDHAVTIGMLPDIERSKYSYVGNTSLSGAYGILLCKEAEEKVKELGSNMIYVELSNEPGYMDEFVSACFLPHTNRDLFPSVEVL